MIRGMVAEVVTGRDGVTRLFQSLQSAVIVVRSTSDEDVLERDTRVAPFWHDGRLENDGYACLCREVVAERSRNVLCEWKV